MKGDGRVFQRGRFWWIAYYVTTPDGPQEVRESSKSNREKDAKQLLRDRQNEVTNDRKGIRKFQGPKAERITVAELLDALTADYEQRGIKSYRRTLNHMKPVREFFGDLRAVNVNPDHIRKYKALRQGEKCSNSTINRGLEILSAAYRLATEEGTLNQRPHISFLSEAGNARKGFFEADELAAILPHLVPPMDDLVRFAYVCGWRKDECRLLRWENVDRSAREVRLTDSKNGEGRVLPLDEETWQLFETLWAKRQFDTKAGTALSEFVFHVKGKPLGSTGFERRWQKAREKAGLPGKLFHDLRRTAARNLVRAGVNQTVAMGITGHKTDSMFRRYNITTATDMRAALEKQRQYLSTQNTTTNVTQFPPKAASGGNTDNE